jgi:signal transduction histidine kinase
MDHSEAKNSASATWLAGGGDMGERMRALDWSRTALGPAETWPQSLRSAVSVCIGSRFPIVLYWGPRRVVLYNDAYAEILGGKHPAALGRPCQEVWAEIWDVIAPMLDGVVATGQATWSQDQLLRLERRGFPEECYFSFSFSPVRGEDGRVEGIFTAVIENTGRVLGERRLALLRDLGARNSAARTARQACQFTVEMLAGSPDVTFALAYLDGALQAMTPDAESVRAGAAPALVKELSIPGGTLVLGISPQRPFDEQYAAFLDLVAAQLASTIGNAHAYEEEKRRAEALAEIDRAKTAFFSNVSHEFRTPLTLMLGPLEDSLADEANPMTPRQRERLELMRRNGLRLQRLVNTLLDFSRIEAGRAQASYAPTDLARFTAELASNFASACEKVGLKLRVSCPPWRSRSTSIAACGKRSSSTSCPTPSSSPSKARIEVALAATGEWRRARRARYRHRHRARAPRAPIRALPPRRGSALAHP